MLIANYYEENTNII